MYKLCYCAVVTVFTCSELLNLLSGAIFHRPPTDLAYSEYLLYTCKRERALGRREAGKPAQVSKE
jgi:hypothetical protein